jgi:hypothetical protein
VTLASAPSTVRNTLFSDDFNRADSTDLGAAYFNNYANPATVNAAIVSQQVRATALNISDPKSADINSVALPNNQWCKFTLPVFGGVQDNELGCVLRANAPTSVGWYWFYARKTDTNNPARNSAIVSHHVAGTGNTNLASDFTTVWGPGDTLIGEAEGTTLRLKRIAAGTSTEITVLTVTDTEYTSGRCGILLWMSNTNGNLANSTLDNLSCGGFSAPTTTTITLDTVSNSDTTNTISWTHTTGSCDSRALVVATQARDDVSAADTAVTTVTLNGTAMTKIRHDRISDAGVHVGSELWYAVAPPVGSSSIQVTWAGALSRVGVGSAVSYCGVHQLTPIDAQSGATGTGGATISSTITTVADNATIVDTFINRPGNDASPGAGQASAVNRAVGSTMDVGMSTFSNKTPAGAETMDWTRSTGTTWTHTAASLMPAPITPVVPPTIISLVADPTGLDATYGPTTPTTIRLVRGDNSGNFNFNSFHPISEFIAGRFTKSGGWESGLDFLCAHPIDASGIENTASGAYRCVSNNAGASTGFSPPLRQTPATLSNAQPANILPFGVGNATISFQMDVTSEARYHTSDVDYDLMPSTNQMTVSSLTASASVAAPNNSTTTYYGRTKYTNAALTIYKNTSSIVMTVQVAAAPGDTTLPSTVTNLACTINGSCVWPAATDNIAIRGYRISLSTDGCATFAFVASPTSPLFTFPSLIQNTTYCTVVRAEDTSGNLSLVDSNQYTFTTPPTPDVQPPSDMTGLRICDVVLSYSLLCFDAPTDDRGVQVTTFQSCYGAGCTNFSIVAQTSAGATTITVPIVAGIVNRFFGYHSDGTNQSLNNSSILEYTPPVGSTTAGVCNCRNKYNAN